MNISIPSPARKRNQGGFVAVLVILILLGLIVAFIATNLRVLAALRSNLKLVEQKQIQRLAHPSTNAPPAPQNLTITNSLAPAIQPANQ